jgi:hypothetical protein
MTDDDERTDISMGRLMTDAHTVYRDATLVAATPRREGVIGIIRCVWSCADGETITDDLIADSYAANWRTEQHAARLTELFRAAGLTEPTESPQAFCTAVVGTRAMLELRPSQRTGRRYIAAIAPAQSASEGLVA